MHQYCSLEQQKGFFCKLPNVLQTYAGMYGFDIAVFSRKDGSIAPQESLGAQSAPILEAFLMTFPGSGRSCCVFGLCANSGPSKNSRGYHGDHSGHECSGYPGLWLYRDIYILYTIGPYWPRVGLLCYRYIALRSQPARRSWCQQYGGLPMENGAWSMERGAGQ